MTLTDAVIGAEALVGHHLTDHEMQLVKTVVSKGMSTEATWDLLWRVLDVVPTAVVTKMIALKIQSGGQDYDATAAVLREDTELRMKRAGV
jgi:hypothetical protein